MNATREAAGRGMSPATARTIEKLLIALALGSLIAIFQPFSKLLSGIGMALVIPAGLLFNLVPLCEPGRPARDLLKTLLIIAVIFVVVAGVAIAAAYLYGVFLRG